MIDPRLLDKNGIPVNVSLPAGIFVSEGDNGVQYIRELRGCCKDPEARKALHRAEAALLCMHSLYNCAKKFGKDSTQMSATLDFVFNEYTRSQDFDIY